ncbi:hypothetical protein ACYJ1Y_01620 [Natrialbaceae archaeon A-gly3]
MVFKRLLGSKATRSMTVLSVVLEAKRAIDRNNRTRAVALLAVAVLAWKWAVLGMAAQGIIKLLRAGK